MTTRPCDNDYEMTFAVPVTSWHRWFAWRPVQTVDRNWVWLRPVWRRRAQIKMHLHPGGGESFFQYAVDEQWKSEGQ